MTSGCPDTSTKIERMSGANRIPIPRYIHNCSRCQFLFRDGGFDLHWHPDKKIGGWIVLRYGDGAAHAAKITFNDVVANVNPGTMTVQEWAMFSALQHLIRHGKVSLKSSDS